MLIHLKGFAIIFLASICFLFGYGTSNAEDGLVNCFDYYHFQSAVTQLRPSISFVQAGTDLDFSGTITNKNSYPLVSGTLYVKIMRSNSSYKGPNATDVVDQFVAKDNITIPAEGTIEVSFPWQVPSNLTSGMYKVVSFFIVDKKFNLLGLSFTDDIAGNIVEFNVTGKDTDVRLSKDEVFINEKPFYFAAFPPRIPSSETAVISAEIVNSTNKDETVKVEWNLYKWDAIDPVNFIRTSFEEVIVDANLSTRVDFSVPEKEAPVYYAVATLYYKDTKSILGIRFVRPEANKLRLNFPSITEFPLKKDQQNTMFSCLHNSGVIKVVENGKLVLKISDKFGRTISEYTYKGNVTDAMMALKSDFVPKKNLDHFFLIAQLWQGDELVDQSKIEYNCNEIDSNLCFPKKVNVLFWALLGAGILVLAGSIVYFIRKRKMLNNKKL